MSDRNNKQYEIERLLNSADKGIGSTRGVGGILARLWRQILKDLNIKPIQFENYLTDFIVSAKKNGADNNVTRSITRGNLRREFEKPTMTFKVFIKGMNFLKVKKLRIGVDAVRRNNVTSTHITSIDLSDQDMADDIYETNAGDTKDTGEKQTLKRANFGVELTRRNEISLHSHAADDVECIALPNEVPEKILLETLEETVNAAA